MLEAATNIIPKRTGCSFSDLVQSVILREAGPSRCMAIQVMSLYVGLLQFHKGGNANVKYMEDTD